MTKVFVAQISQFKIKEKEDNCNIIIFRMLPCFNMYYHSELHTSISDTCIFNLANLSARINVKHRGE